MAFWDKLQTRSRSNLYFALLFFDRERREAFRDVYRFLRAADDVADAPRPAGERRRELEAWRCELDHVYAGRASHPVARRLAHAVRRFSLSRAHFDAVLDELERDIDRTGVSSWPALRGYCERLAGSLGLLCLELLDCRGPAAHGYARQVGAALQLANIVRDVREDAARGVTYLPRDELAAAGVPQTDLAAGRLTPGLRAVLRRQADRARDLIATGRRDLSADLSRQLLVPEIWADVYLALLDELEASDFDVFRPRPLLRRRRKLAIALARWSQTTGLYRRASMW